MAASLSEDEFQRLQLQLIELRGHSYQLTDKCRLLETELTNLRAKYDVTEKDLQRANKALSKNKKAKDLELLLQDNDNLQQKLLSQEEEFRIQNATLMQELSTVIARNEALELLSKQMPKQGIPSDACERPDSELESELRRLQAANAVLQRHLEELQHWEVKPSGSNDLDHSNAVEGVAEDPDLSDRAADNVDTAELRQECIPSSHQTSLSEAKTYNELKVQAETESEENRLLKMRLAALEKSSRADAEALQCKLDEITEKLRKKQEAFSQFQANNEAVLAEARKKVEYLEDARQRDSRNSRSIVEKLQDELSSSRKESESFKVTSLQYIAKLEAMVKSLEAQVSESSVAYTELRKHELETVKAENDSLKSQLASSGQLIDQLRSALKESEQRSAALDMRVKDAENKMDAQVLATQDAVKVAEKRKGLLDELAMKAVEDDDRYKKKLKDLETSHQQELRTLTESHRLEVDSLSQTLGEAQDKLKEYSRFKQEVLTLTQQNQSVEQAKDWLQRRLKDSEDALKCLEVQHAEQLSEIVQSHEAALLSAATLHKKEMEDICTLNVAMAEENKRLQGEVQSLQQQIKDAFDEVRLHEKKGASLLKDLKKQVGLERSRAERLEQRLQELLSDTRTIKTLCEDFPPRAMSPDQVNKDETSSISSWTSHATGGGNQGRDVSLASASHEVAARASPQLQADSRRLGSDYSLVEELSKEKRILEEKVSMLEQSSSAMAEDLLQKQAIIEHYISEGKEYVSARPSEEKLTLKRVVDFVKDRGDETLKEKYRKAQRILEETLTKNMFLQKDLEALSQEVAKLRNKE